MQGVKRVICAICMVLIIIFGLIHLAVSISIISNLHPYGDIFRPEIGLASFNIVIGVYALLVGGFGLFAVLTYRDILSEIVAIATILLVIFTIASLIAALAIHSLAINYVNSRFSNYMSSYKQNPSSTDIIDRIQTSYDCCGSTIWLDWSGLLPNATQNSTNATTTIASVTTTAGGGEQTTTSAGGIVGTTTGGEVVGTTTGGGVVGTTTSGGVVGTTTSGGPVDTTGGGVVGTTTSGGPVDTTGGGVVTTTGGGPAGTTGGGGAEGSTGGGSADTTAAAPVNDMVNIDKVIDKREILDSTIENSVIEKDAELKSFQNTMNIADASFISKSETSDDTNSAQNPCPQNIRQKRQMSSSNSSMYGLPSSFNVILPQSCCINDLSTINIQYPYCMSNTNTFHTTGCAKILSKRSVGQTIGLAVINSCLFILSIAAIGLVVVSTYDANPQQDQSANYPMQQNGYANHPTQHNGYANHPMQHGGYANQPMQYNAYVNQPMQQYPQTYGFQSAAAHFPGMGYYNNYNPPTSQYF